MEKLPDIAELETKIRDLINEPRKRHLLRNQGYSWSQLCASLDAIGDSQLAIEAFPIAGTERDRGALYLSIYGLLQACFLQQDSIQHLGEALGLKESYKDHSQLLTIRELRNDAVGHPTKRNPKPPHRYCSISRMSMSSAGFKMLVEEGGKSDFRYVSLPEVIADQRMYVRELLSSILAMLQKELTEHREQFKMEKIENSFTNQFTYWFEQISKGVYESGPDKAAHAGMGLRGLEHVRGVLTSVQDALTKRGLDLNAYSGIGHLYEEVRHPSERLEAFLEAKKAAQKPPIDEETASAFLSFLRAKLKELREMAREVDEEYES
jgi:tetratricopeptide (TPR) repeat protein